MNEALSFDQALSLGSALRIQRILTLLPKRELAAMAGVTEQEVELFESSQYINPIAKHKLLRTFDLVKWINDKPKMLFKTPIIYPF